MPKERITAAIREVLNEQFGFEIYIVMKQEEQLVKRFVLDEGNPNETNGFKTKLRESIKEAIENKFLNNDSRYANGDDLANEQNCFYVIKQDDAYHPFRYLGDSNKPIENFKLSDKDSAYAVLFKLSFQRNGECQTAHCGRHKLHFAFGSNTFPIVPYRHSPQALCGLTADCRSFV